MNKIRILCKSVWVIYILLLTNPTQAQEKRALTLEDIFQQNTLGSSSVYGINWMNDGRFYTSIRYDIPARLSHILKYDITTGEVVDTLVNGHALRKPGTEDPLFFTSYSLSADEQQVLLATEEESIYRRSSKAHYYLLDLQSKALRPLAAGEKQSYATFSPDGKKVAYVRKNELFYLTINDMKEYAVTTDGEFNHIINGSADWVYEEEFSFAKGFFWSPDSKKIAFLRFDESAVKEYNMQTWGQLYPNDYRFKYPKAGEANSQISALIYHLPAGKAAGKLVSVDTGKESDIYLPRLKWTKNPDLLSVVRMNRLQNRLEILHAEAATGNTQLVLKEESDTYVDLDYNDHIEYLPNNSGILRTSEQDGFKHIYLYDINGKLIRQITKGQWEVTELVGFDDDRKLVYFISAEDSPLERQLYRISLKGKNKTKLSKEAGVNAVNMSPDYRYYIQYHSSATKPLSVTLHAAPSGKQLKVLEDNAALRQQLANVQLNTKEFFSFTTEDGTTLNGYMIKPADFDENKEYPVLMYVYGGPGSQTVMNNFSTSREYWHSYLADQGYIVVSVDNRGTGARGREFKHTTYKNLGKQEVADQIAAGRYLADLSYVDADRIGIWGWSYGGYMSSLALLMGNDVFSTAIAVAPVTNWRYYDSIYTERYLQRPQDNPEGYDAYSPVTHADKLQGNLLLIHGTGDDNVHFQNAIALQDALIAANKQFDSFYYPNRNHGIYGGNTRLHLFTMMTDYLLEKLPVNEDAL